jgi:hypothetical protein
MLFKVSDDWKQLLATDDEAKLNDLLKKVSRHRSAYKNAHDVKNAQLWAALLEMRKENLALQNRIRRLEDVLDGAKERMRKQDEQERELLESLERF